MRYLYQKLIGIINVDKNCSLASNCYQEQFLTTFIMPNNFWFKYRVILKVLSFSQKSQFFAKPPCLIAKIKLEKSVQLEAQ